ncbi:cbb3-type cytochrome c oxidase subunit II [Spiribacter halobius]|uniref:Cytochrome-c oxidase n=1 Tax=Sediminicurvatus halobius TaxID=2182432 RepID=A0A2U2MVQ8_9GAMM|nr:cbb3-type cytochrome c oxidase subunit II [Spiribacter halobius]PWG60943.1 cytochrome-c oxidase [Spiribacter halobius]UEX76610.1 cbb3-type cytochrome c oxidase subunit II [Spiribacter halobius]
MKRTVAIMAGAALILLFATLMLVVMPYVQMASEPVPKDLEPYTEAELRGRQLYISEGCMYCHSQQPRDPGYSAADSRRGWGRAAVPGDYAYDQPHLMGTMRTGPDLLNIGARQPSQQWHLIHLYNPRAVSPDSTMPPYRYLFEVVGNPLDGETVVEIPAPYGPDEGVVVTTQAVEDLVAYLKALDRTYPADALPREQTGNEGEGEP